MSRILNLRQLFITGAFVSLSISAGIWAASVVATSQYVHRRSKSPEVLWVLRLSNGSMSMEIHEPHPRASARPRPSYFRPRTGGIAWLPQFASGPPHRSAPVFRCSLPLWLPAGLLCSLVVVQTRGWHRPSGACDRCGYDVSGITINRCPECGCSIRSGSGER